MDKIHLDGKIVIFHPKIEFVPKREWIPYHPDPQKLPNRPIRQHSRRIRKNNCKSRRKRVKYCWARSSFNITNKPLFLYRLLSRLEPENRTTLPKLANQRYRVRIITVEIRYFILRFFYPIEFRGGDRLFLKAHRHINERLNLYEWRSATVQLHARFFLESQKYDVF